MKYNILINQKAVIDAGFKLDIVDLAIFELLKDFALTAQCKKMTEGENVFFLFNWKLINTQLPILGLNSRQAVFKRLEKLRTEQIVVPHENNATLGKSWYSFGPNYHKLVFIKASTVVDGGANESLQPSVNNGLHNNTLNSNNIIKDKEQPAQIIYKKKVAFLALVIEWVKANPGKYPKLMYLAFAKYWVELKKGSQTQIRYDAEQYFEVGKRLSTWFSNTREKEMQEYWDNEGKIGTINDLFKKQILFIDGTETKK